MCFVNIKFLLEVGANPNICSNEGIHLEIAMNFVHSQGNSPLFYASLYGQSELVKLLLAKGADPSIVNEKVSYF
jgi:ankyrin repeat protein